MLRKWLCQADIKIIIEPVDPVLIKSGYATVDGEDMVPVATFKNGQRVHYFPGSSLKGVLRSHLERIAHTLHPGSVCLPYYDPKKRASIAVPVASAYGCGYRKYNPLTSAVYADSCAACRVFGSLQFGGRFSIGDAYPLPDKGPTLESRDGVAINRHTGGTVQGALFDLQVLVGGQFSANLRVMNFELWQLAALNLLLMDMANEMIFIGSGRSRGLGRVHATVTSYHLTYMEKFNQLQGLYQLATPKEQCDYRLHDWTPSDPIDLPTPHTQGLRQQYDLSDDWCKRLHPLIPAFEAFLQWSDGPQGEIPNVGNPADEESIS